VSLLVIAIQGKDKEILRSIAVGKTSWSPCLCLFTNGRYRMDDDVDINEKFRNGS
jgi:hypothetical protein